MYNFKFSQACMGQTQLVSFQERRGRHCDFWDFFALNVFPSSFHCVSIYSQWVPIKFSLCFHLFPMGSQHDHQHVLNGNSLCLICFAQCCPLWTYIREPIFRLIYFYIWRKHFYIGSLKSFSLVVIGIKTIVIERNPRLINIWST
jgi:hypothetical protein